MSPNFREKESSKISSSALELMFIPWYPDGKITLKRIKNLDPLGIYCFTPFLEGSYSDERNMVGP